MPPPPGGNVPDWLSVPGIAALLAVLGKGVQWLATRRSTAHRTEVDTFAVAARDTGATLLTSARDVILLLREDLSLARAKVQELDGSLATLQARLAAVEDAAAEERRRLRREAHAKEEEMEEWIRRQSDEIRALRARLRELGGAGPPSG